MEWVSLDTKKPKQREDCLVLDDDGANGIGIPKAKHWMKFESPHERKTK